MYRLLLSLFTVLTAVSSIPASAASSEPRSAWSFNDMLNQSSQILTETITRGLAIIQDRIEMETTTIPSTDGEEATNLRLKLFPNGKSQPDDAIGLEGTFRRSPDASANHFGFDFRIIPPTRNADAKEYI
jgi:hypothetical protein